LPAFEGCAVGFADVFGADFSFAAGAEAGFAPDFELGADFAGADFLPAGFAGPAFAAPAFAAPDFADPAFTGIAFEVFFAELDFADPFFADKVFTPCPVDTRTFAIRFSFSSLAFFVWPTRTLKSK
jgi:hypothetical protein